MIDEFIIKTLFSHPCADEDNKLSPHLFESMLKCLLREFLYGSHVCFCVQKFIFISALWFLIIDIATLDTRWIDLLSAGALQKEKKPQRSLLNIWLRVITSSKAIVGRKESIMNWNIPWFSHRNYPPSTRLNISHNEWHKLLYPLIIKIRIMTLFWTHVHADSQGHSFISGLTCNRAQRWNELNVLKIVFQAFFLLPRNSLMKSYRDKTTKWLNF